MIIRIEYTVPNSKQIINLFVDNSTLFNLRSNPLPKDVKGSELVSALREMGATYCDVLDKDNNRIPAIQEFDLKTGIRTFLEHRQNGNRILIKEFNSKTGNIDREENYALDFDFPSNLNNSKFFENECKKSEIPKILEPLIIWDATPI